MCLYYNPQSAQRVWLWWYTFLVHINRHSRLIAPKKVFYSHSKMTGGCFTIREVDGHLNDPIIFRNYHTQGKLLVWLCTSVAVSTGRKYVVCISCLCAVLIDDGLQPLKIQIYHQCCAQIPVPPVLGPASTWSYYNPFRDGPLRFQSQPPFVAHQLTTFWVVA